MMLRKVYLAISGVKRQLADGLKNEDGAVEFSTQILVLLGIGAIIVIVLALFGEYLVDYLEQFFEDFMADIGSY